MHTCIGCGGACYCHGDIDDCQVETEEYSSAHCETCGCAHELDPWDEPDPWVAEGRFRFLPAPRSDR